jgi:hypothetical protein
MQELGKEKADGKDRMIEFEEDLQITRVNDLHAAVRQRKE